VNIFAKCYIITLSGFFFFGTLSCYMLEELWQLGNINYLKSFYLYIIVILCVGIVNYNTKDVSKKFKDINISSNLLKVMFVLWIVSILLSLLIVTKDLKVPLGHMFNLYTLLFPGIAIISKRPYLGYFTLSLLILTHVISANRVYLASGLIIFLVAKSKNKDIKIFRNMLFVSIIVMLISFLKVEDGELSFEPLEFIINISSKLGSEWRDGIILNDVLSAQQKDMGRLAYLQSILTVIPLHSVIGLISYQDYYPNLVSTQLLYETDLASLGYTGIRIGIIWEISVLFGYVGVVVYSLITGLILRSCWKMNNGVDGFIISCILLATLIYSQIGMINFIFGIYLSGLILVCITQAVFKALITRNNGV